MTVRAPVDGQVLRVLHESAGVVAAGEPLLEVGNARELEIVLELLSTDAVQVHEGDPVIIEEWGGAGFLNGLVRRIEPTGFTKVSALGIEEQRVVVVIDIADPPEIWRRLGHGFRVEVRIVIWRSDDVLRVPVGALFREGQDWAVFTVTDGLAQKRIVRIGHSNAIMAEVLDGLAEDEYVLLHPSDRIAEGTAVVTRDGAE